MFTIRSDCKEGDKLFTLRVLFRREDLYLSLKVLGVEKKASEEAEKYLYDEFAVLFDKVSVENLYNRIYKYKFIKKDLREKKALSKEFRCFSNYLSHLLCKLMEKVFHIIDNKDLYDVFQVLNTKYRLIYSSKDYQDIIGNIHFIQGWHVKEIEKLPLGKTMPIFSDFKRLLQYIREEDSSFKDNAKFKLVCRCVQQCIIIKSRLFDLALSIAEICEIQEIQQDGELISKLYPIYKEIRCFLTEEQKVDLSFYEEKLAREEEAKKEEGISGDSLLKHGTEMVDNISDRLKHYAGKRKLTQESVQKFSDSLKKCKQQLDEMYEMDKTSDSVEVGSPKYKNTFEDQEEQVKVIHC